MGKDLQGEPTYGVGFNGVVEAIKHIAKGESLGVVPPTVFVPNFEARNYIPGDPQRPNQCRPVNAAQSTEALTDEVKRLTLALETTNSLLSELYTLIQQRF